MEIQQQPQFLSLDDLVASAIPQASVETPSPVEVPQPTLELPIPEPTPEPTPAPVIEEKKPESFYTSKIQNLLNDGFLEDYAVNIDGEEVYLSEANVKDEDTYKLILQSVKEAREAEIKTKYIPKEGLNETTEKLVDILRSGGDVTELLEKNVQEINTISKYKEDLEGFDLDDKQKEQLAINVVAQSLQQKGLSQKVIQAQIEDYIENGNLETEATTVLDSYLSYHKEEISRKHQEQVDRLNQEKENLKTFKKTLTSTCSELGFPDNIKKVLVENATKQDEMKVTNADKLYFEIQEKNPKLFAKIVYQMHNEEEFEKWVSSKRVTEAKKELIRPSLVINTNKTREAKARATSYPTLEELAQNQFNK